jgi:hypothetical protein
MKCTVLSILARNNFNNKQAIRYCTQMAKDYPRLKAEYKSYVLALRLGKLLGR